MFCYNNNTRTKRESYDDDKNTGLKGNQGSTVVLSVLTRIGPGLSDDAFLLRLFNSEEVVEEREQGKKSRNIVVRRKWLGA